MSQRLMTSPRRLASAAQLDNARSPQPTHARSRGLQTRPHSHLGLHPQVAKPPEAGARLSAVHRLLTKQHSKHGLSRPFPALDQRVLRPQSPPGPCPGCGPHLRLKPRRSHPPTFTLPPSGAASPPRPASPRRGRLPHLHPPSGTQKDSQRAGAAAVARWGPDVPDGRG